MDSENVEKDSEQSLVIDPRRILEGHSDRLDALGLGNSTRCGHCQFNRCQYHGGSLCHFSGILGNHRSRHGYRLAELGIRVDQSITGPYNGDTGSGTRGCGRGVEKPHSEQLLFLSTKGFFSKSTILLFRATQQQQKGQDEDHIYYSCLCMALGQATTGPKTALQGTMGTVFEKLLDKSVVQRLALFHRAGIPIRVPPVIMNVERCTMANAPRMEQHPHHCTVHEKFHLD